MQMLTRRRTPFSYKVALWTLADHRVRVLRCEWLTLLPDWPTLEQISHLAIELPLTALRGLSRIGPERVTPTGHRRGPWTVREFFNKDTTAARNSANAMTAAMPGRVLSVAVSVGDTVSRGDLICVIEAMKMEQKIGASRDGIIAAVHVSSGDSVAHGQTLVEFE